MTPPSRPTDAPDQDAASAPDDTGSAAIRIEARALSKPEVRAWAAVQIAVWLIGVGIVVALVVAPEIGIHALWNVLIPVAPALLVVAPGLWRNICPLGSTVLLPRHMGLSRARPVSGAWASHLALIGVVLLLLIVPLRHVVFDTSGPATALVLVVLSALGLTMGWLFQGKSGWCSGVCPVHPVEKLYGQAPLVTPPNAHCRTCTRCVAPCPETIPAGHPLSGRDAPSSRLAGTLLVGGFAGYIWGWFQVPDYLHDGWSHLWTAYSWPLLGTCVSLAAYLPLRALLGRSRRRVLVRVFAAAAVACYYWFRIPALVGFGPYPGDGMLIDLTGSLPAWFPAASQLTTTALFAYLLVLRRGPPRTWTVRPPYAT